MTKTTTKNQIPSEIRERITVHGNQTAYHRGLKQELGLDYEVLETWDDLRESFPFVTDERLRRLEPSELVPAEYDDTTLEMSRSSGTTGKPKTVYWHTDDIQANVDALVEVFDAAAIPRGGHWVATATPNPVLKETLRRLARRYNGAIELIEVDPEPIKQALASSDEARIVEALSAPAERVRCALMETDAVVYEDIAPLMGHVGETLPEHVRRNVEQLFIGGVGTTGRVIRRLTDEAFPNATLTGWYGDYMNGFVPMRAPMTLEYSPQHPDVRFDIVDPENPRQLVALGERGAVVSHAIRRGFFLPNRWVGDSARRITIDGEEGLADIERLEAEPPTNLSDE